MNHSEYASNYKRTVAGRFMLVDGDKLMEKVAGSDFCATRKLDGVMAVIFIDEGEVALYGSHGKQIEGNLPCIKELKETAARLGISSGILAGELYATISRDGRERVCDVAQALADQSLHSQLRLGLFDVMELNGSAVETHHYKEKLAMLRRLFGVGDLVRPVAGKVLTSRQEVANLFEKVVTEHGAEGLVVHNESGLVYKIKPRHTIDAVVIGYTAGEDTRCEMVRDILVAVMHEDGTFRQVASVGGGLTDDMRHNIYQRLSQTHVDSDYVETDSRNIAFQMVRPEMVVEISAVDYVTENSAGEAKENMLLEYADGSGYEPVGKTPGVALHSPVIVRERNDKYVVSQDVSLRQLTELCEFAKTKTVSYSHLPKSKLLTRRLFIKRHRGRVSVQKFLLWQTNKETVDPNFPTFVAHHTDYSFSRKEPLRRDIRISNDRQQIFQLLDEMMECNIKKGWEEIV